MKHCADRAENADLQSRLHDSGRRGRLCLVPVMAAVLALTAPAGVLAQDLPAESPGVSETADQAAPSVTAQTDAAPGEDAPAAPATGATEAPATDAPATSAAAETASPAAARATGEDAPAAPATNATEAPATEAPATDAAAGTAGQATAPATSEGAQGGATESPAASEPAAAGPAVPATAAATAQPAPAADGEFTLRRVLANPALLLSQPEEGAQKHELSPVGMYRNADIVVKLVMLGLIFASLVTWTIWLAKLIEIFWARGRARRAAGLLRRAASLDDAARWAGGRRGAPAEMLRAAIDEVERSTPAAGEIVVPGLKERVASVLDQIVATASRRAAVGTGILATIGATAPFVGLFGTVWGIMNAFIGISEAQSSSLAVVAPGIAEALLATALGLIAAIPAVIIYNVNSRTIGGYRHMLTVIAAGIERLLSRDLDFNRISAPGARPVRADT